ncbi:hypothetical protein F4802DRAFT_219341 [Xylaria palmicola]|nr:hypothetical protein F4802DRAFT_219341 [Xylaria palmicola]
MTCPKMPPPPTRSRKIIQMKPRPQEGEETLAAPVVPAKGAAAAIAKHAAGSGVAAPKTTTASTIKKQPSATSAAGRKITRKTLHLIERRRRSKMNEELAVLKVLIPVHGGDIQAGDSTGQFSSAKHLSQSITPHHTTHTTL